MGTLAKSEDPDERLHFGRVCLFAKITCKSFFRERDAIL